MKRVRIHTFGCQMNVYDSERMQAVLAPLGYVLTEEDCEADLIILNTCSVRDKPEQKVLSLLGRLAPLKSRNPGLKLAVGGCVGKQHGQALLEQVPYLDLVFGPDQVGMLADLVKQLDRGGSLADVHETREHDQVFGGDNSEVAGGVSAFLSIMKGCDQYCSYCIVPYVRGREISRPLPEILDHARRLLDRGVRELVLLGQNVNRYGMDRPGQPGFVDVLRSIHELPGLERISFVTSNPGDCPDELIACYADLPKLISFFHLPMQSGSDRILKLMNRRYTRRHYFDLVDKLRRVRPELHVSTDLIVGFPSETEADFEETMSAARELRWGSSFSFMYSVRPGTAAEKLPDDVPAAEKRRRLLLLQALLEQCLHEGLGSHNGKVVRVLVEGESQRGKGQLTGRSMSNYIVNFSAPAGVEPAVLVGTQVDVKVTRALSHSLFGEMKP